VRFVEAGGENAEEIVAEERRRGKETR